MSVSDKIKKAAVRNAELLSVIAETNNAEPTASEHDRSIASIEKEILVQEKSKNLLEQRKNLTQANHERYRDSHVKRFFYKAAGKKERYHEKASVEEQKHFAVLSELHQVDKSIEGLRVEHENSLTLKPDLDKEVKRHRDAVAELDTLYNSIFGGPTPDFPQEDQAEQCCVQASQEFRQLAQAETQERSAVTFLTNAVKLAVSAQGSMEKALDYSRADMFGGGMMMDMMERSHLGKADKAIAEARMLAARAKDASPIVADMPTVNVNTGNIMSDVFFDNIFTDMAFHDEIKRAMRELGWLLSFMNSELEASRKRHAGLLSQAQAAEQNLTEARQMLQTARSSIMEQVLNGSSTGNVTVPLSEEAQEPPPSYQSSV